ncbi:MAG: helix-turn-helix domain-containing protein [Tetragenococcus halophilus]|nr:helix-turn-helix domain-containing protein [Tetragenococcus halophilus]
MKIVKKYSEKYTVVDNHIINDERLSWKARGLFMFLWSRPSDWSFFETEVEKHSKKDGRSSLRSGIKELEECGYIKRKRVRNQKGQVSTSYWELCDKPTLEKPTLDKPTQDNRTLLSTNELSTNELSTNKKNSSKQVSSNTLSEDFEKLWKLYPKKTGKKKAFTSYKRVIKKGVTNKEIQTGIVKYKRYLSQNEWLQPADGSTWFNNERWEDEFQIENDQQTPSKYDNTNWEEKLKQEGLM